MESYFNKTKKPVWIGTVKVMPGTARPVDPRFIPKVKKIDVAQAVASIFGDLNATKSMDLVKTLDQEKLAEALTEEQAGKKRKSVIEAINKRLLEFKAKDTGRNDELEAFAAHWSNQSADAIRAHLETEAVQNDQAKQDILNSVLGEQDA